MRAFVLSLCCALLSSMGAYAASPLEDLARAIDSLGRYEVSFAIYVDGVDASGEGRYVVDGDSFCLEIANQEIYGDSQERCSVDHTNREVVMERIETDHYAPMIVLNPAKAFTELARDFDYKVVGDEGDKLALQLTPKSSANILESTLLEIDKTTNLPQIITYFAEGDVVEVLIKKIGATEREIHPAYPDSYDVIDIR